MPKAPDIAYEVSKAWRLLTSPLRKRPVFLIPGAPKSGTSSLFDAICEHPQIARGMRKEPTSLTKYPGSEARLRMNFPFAWRSDKICGDASVEYWSHPDAPRAARDLLPDAKLVVAFRDPVERAWSDYRMFRRSGHETEDFTDIVESSVRWLTDRDAARLCASALRNSFNPLRYVRCGMYSDILEKWQRHYSPRQILVLISEEFFAKPRETLEKVWRHFELTNWKLEHVPRARVSEDREPIPPRARKLLEDFYAPLNKRLGEILTRSFPWS